MRIPKFRAWDKINEEMFDITRIDFYMNEVRFIDDSLIVAMKMEDVVLMQSTNYEDDSKTEIFEYDILVDDDGYIIGYVEMDDDSWRVDGNFLSDVVANGCLVRGNRFTHSELLNHEK